MASRNDEAKALDDWRRQHLARAKTGIFCRMSDAQLNGFEIFPGCRLGDPEILVPERFMPAGAGQQRNSRLLRVSDGLPSPDKLAVPRATAVHALQAVMAPALFVPRTSRSRRGHLPKAGTWITFCRRLFRFSSWVLENRPSEHSVFEHLTLASCTEAVRATAPAVGWMVSETAKLKALGAVTDWPDLPLSQNDVYLLVDMPEKIAAGGAEPARATATGRSYISGRTAAAKPGKSAAAKPPLPHQPLPDRFVSECSRRVLWFVEKCGPKLLEIFDLQELGERRSRRRREDACDTATDSSRDFPFSIQLSFRGVGKQRPLNRLQDIKTKGQLKGLLYLLQLCHFYLVSLSMAARESEVFSLRRGCLVGVDDAFASQSAASHGRVAGKTFKLVTMAGGKSRDWPLHEVAAAAIRQQETLAGKISEADDGPLWVQFYPGKDGNGPSEAGSELKAVKLERIVSSFGLEHLIDEHGLHHHRFRKTVVRLAALALVGAPKILMDFLGHESLAMTLQYILSDPDIAADIERVAAEMVLINVGSAVTATESHGGAAGRRINAFLERQARKGEQELDVADVEEAARLISLNGVAWTLVREGVVCTKLPYKAGPCTRSRGAPDHARCEVDCAYRFEHVAGSSDAERAVRDLCGRLQAREDWRDHTSRWLVGQLRFQLRRFPAVRSRWESHPVLARLQEWEALNLAAGN